MTEEQIHALELSAMADVHADISHVLTEHDDSRLIVELSRAQWELVVQALEIAGGF